MNPETRRVMSGKAARMFLIQGCMVYCGYFTAPVFA